MKQNSIQTVVLRSDREIRFKTIDEAKEAGFSRDDVYIFDSEAEHQRYHELCLLEMGNEVREIEVHPTFILSEVYNRTYTPDFVYWMKIDFDEFVRLAGVLEQSYRDISRLIESDNSTWILVAEDVKGIKSNADGSEEHLLRGSLKNGFELKHDWFRTLYPRYLFLLYPPLKSWYD